MCAFISAQRPVSQIWCAAQSATEELERLEHAFDRVKKQLFDRLHGILREQLFHDPPVPGAVMAPAAVKAPVADGGRRLPQLRAHTVSTDSDEDDDTLGSLVAGHAMENNNGS